jgi:hypothetical protein
VGHWIGSDRSSPTDNIGIECPPERRTSVGNKEIKESKLLVAVASNVAVATSNTPMAMMAARRVFVQLVQAFHVSRSWHPTAEMKNGPYRYFANCHDQVLPGLP